MYEQSPAQPSQPSQSAAGSLAGAYYPTVGGHSQGYRAAPSNTAAAGPSVQTTVLPNGVTSPAGGLKPILRIKIAETISGPPAGEPYLADHSQHPPWLASTILWWLRPSADAMLNVLHEAGVNVESRTHRQLHQQPGKGAGTAQSWRGRHTKDSHQVRFRLGTEVTRRGRWRRQQQQPMRSDICQRRQVGKSPVPSC